MSNDDLDYLDTFASDLVADEIRARRAAARAAEGEPRWQPFLEAVRTAPDVEPSHREFGRPVVELGRADDLDPESAAALRRSLEAFVPWKKGPFSIFGTEIDAEWRSDFKWERWQGHYTALDGRRVADVGCHNGYFMFRMAAENPRCVIGFEPVLRHRCAFDLLQRYARRPVLHFELLAADDLELYPQFFDTIFCLGVLYHVPDPIRVLRILHRSLATGGELLVDCQGVDSVVRGEQLPSWAFVPPGRYARARGVWFLPTRETLETWLRRTGFREVETIYAAPLETTEQRRTEWAPIDSLAESLDPTDSTRTVEGHPAPWRFYVRATK